MKAADSLTVEFTCVEARSSDSGHRARLLIPLPPPKPVQDGYGNHIAHPPPPVGQISVFVTSDKRQQILYRLEPMQRARKALRPEYAADANHAAAIQAERDALDKEIQNIAASLADCGEMAFEHGAVYEVTFRKKGAAKGKVTT